MTKLVKNIDKILVTGGSGFIGSNFIRYISSHYPELQIINLDKITYAGNPENLRDIEDNPQYTFVRGDICNPKVVEDVCRKGPQAIVNFAAETHVDRSIGSPEDFLKTDVYGTYILLEAARKHNLRRFVHISTDEVYGEAEDAPSTEDSPLYPKSPYAASKAGADRLAWAYFATYGTPVVIGRCANNYGPCQYPEKLIPLLITNAIEDKPLPIYGDGKNVRDWIYVEDHCRALELLLFTEGIEGEAFNIGASEEHPNLEVAEIILNILGKPRSLLTYVNDRPGHVRRHAVAADKIKAALGWQAAMPFPEGMEHTINWYIKRPEWWRKIKTGAYLEYYRQHYGQLHHSNK